jgi:DNA-binding transcriptional LysR family regulator
MFIIAMTDMRGIDLNLLIVLDALLDERSVTRAAARLGYTQSTTSGMPARLRDLFDDPLFVRVQRGILPTPRAQSLAAPLKQPLADGRRLIAREAFDPATAEVTFAVSANDTCSTRCWCHSSRNCSATRPRLRLAQGALDLAVTIPQFAMSDLPSRLLYREHYVAAVRQGHPLARDDFLGCDHVLVSPTGDHSRARPTRSLPGSGGRAACAIPFQAFCSCPTSSRLAT